jgi:hypothetical protein
VNPNSSHHSFSTLRTRIFEQRSGLSFHLLTRALHLLGEL